MQCTMWPGGRTRGLGREDGPRWEPCNAGLQENLQADFSSIEYSLGPPVRNPGTGTHSLSTSAVSPGGEVTGVCRPRAVCDRAQNYQGGLNGYSPVICEEHPKGKPRAGILLLLGFGQILTYQQSKHFRRGAGDWKDK